MNESTSTALTSVPSSSPQTSLVSCGTREMKDRQQAIQQLMADVMKPDVHYGIVPGAKKPSLWKPGAELICSLFGLVPNIKTTVTNDDPDRVARWKGVKYVDGPSGRVQVEVEGETYGVYELVSVCELLSQGGQILASCSASANNVENKYRGLSMWDVRNTLRKMSEKRSLVGGVLMATGASDMFSQDLEDLPDGHPERPAGGVTQKSANGAATGTVSKDSPSSNGLSDKQNGLAFIKAKANLGLTGAELDAFMLWFKHLPKDAKKALDLLIPGGDGANKVLASFKDHVAKKAAIPGEVIPAAATDAPSDPPPPPASDNNGGAE